MTGNKGLKYLVLFVINLWNMWLLLYEVKVKILYILLLQCKFCYVAVYHKHVEFNQGSHCYQWEYIVLHKNIIIVKGQRFTVSMFFLKYWLFNTIKREKLCTILSINLIRILTTVEIIPSNDDMNISQLPLISLSSLSLTDTGTAGCFCCSDTTEQKTPSGGAAAGVL